MRDFHPNTSALALCCLVRALHKAGVLPIEEFKTQITGNALSLWESGETAQAEDLVRLIEKLLGSLSFPGEARQ